MTPKELADHVRQVLASDLGTFPNGAPAVWVDEYDIPEGRAIGLQVVIQPVPDVSQFVPTSGHVAYMTSYLVVEMVQFDRSRSLAKALEKIRSSFHVASEVVIPRSKDTFERATLKIFNPGFTNFPLKARRSPTQGS